MVWRTGGLACPKRTFPNSYDHFRVKAALRVMVSWGWRSDQGNRLAPGYPYSWGFLCLPRCSRATVGTVLGPVGGGDEGFWCE
jgi:hypothetical protein